MSLKKTLIRILRKTESITGTDMVYVAKHSAWLTLGNIIATASSFLLAIAFANFLPEDVYGTYKYVLSLVALLNLFSLAGLNTSLSRSVARGADGALWPIVKMKLRWGTLASIASLGISAWYWQAGDMVLTLCFLVVATILPFMNALSVYPALLSGRALFPLVTRYDIFTKLITLSALGITVILTEKLWIIILVYFAAYLVNNLILFHLTIKRVRPNTKQEPQTIRFGKELTALDVISTVVDNLDKILIFHFIGPVELAIYGLALTPVDQIKNQLKTIRRIAFPKLSSQRLPILQRTLPKKVALYSLSIVGIALLYIVLCPFIYMFFFPKYLESILFSQVLAIGLVFYPKALFGSALTAQMKTKALYMQNAISYALKLGLMIGLLPLLGVWGIIVAYLGKDLVDYLVLYWLFKRA